MSNRYVAVNQAGELATLPSGKVLCWNQRPNARAESKKQAQKWSIVTVNSRRFHGAVAKTFSNDHRPIYHYQDTPKDETTD